MTFGEKTELIKWVNHGDIRKAIDKLLTIKRTKKLDKEAEAIASRYNRLKREERLGILTPEQVNIRENQIVAHLIEIIHHPENKPYSVGKPTDNPNTASNKVWKYIAAIAITITTFICLEIFGGIDIIPSNNSLQLTVFVEDKQGNPALAGQGRINIALGNRSLNGAIGENGRVNFPDILLGNKGDTITIGLKAEGWEIAGKNVFIFNGDPIILKVKRDNSLGIIRGRVTNQDGQEFIEGAKVVVKDTAVLTDDNRRDHFTKRFKAIKDHFNGKAKEDDRYFTLGKDYTIYSFRHTFITRLYQQMRKDLTPFETKSHLMLITGHSTMTALEKYLRDIDAELPKDYSGFLE